MRGAEPAHEGVTERGKKLIVGREAFWYRLSLRLHTPVSRLKRATTPTQFWGYVRALEIEADERKAEYWYSAQVALQIDKLRNTVLSLFAKQPAYRKIIKDFLIPFVPAGKGKDERPPDDGEIPGGYTAPADVDPELLRLAKIKASKIGVASWGRALGIIPGQKKPAQKLKTRLPDPVTGKPVAYRPPNGRGDGRRTPGRPPRS